MGVWYIIWSMLATKMVLEWRMCDAATDGGDLKVLQNFLQNVGDKTQLSNWNGNDPCGSNKWVHIKCVGASVSALEMTDLSLGGTVTPDLNQLKSLATLQLQGNGFTGSLPSLNGLTSLTRAYFGRNSFSIIPGDFFTELTSLTEIYLDDNHLNSTDTWILPDDVKDCSKLQKLSITNTTLSGTIPDFLGTMNSLQYLYVAYNRLHGSIPTTFSGSNIIEFQANNQQGAPNVLSGPIDPVAGMESLALLWIHVNQFHGIIPPGLGNLSSLEDIRLNDNQFVGTIPESLTTLPALKNLTIKGNNLVGSLPKFSFPYDASPNGFCQSTPGVPCDPRVSALLDFIGAANGFTSPCSSNWIGNDPCDWNGVHCIFGNVTTIRLPDCQLTGTLDPSLAKLNWLTTVVLKNNRLSGLLPEQVVRIPSLKILDLYNNSISGPLPDIPNTVSFNVSANPLTPMTPASGGGGPGPGVQSPGTDTPGNVRSPGGTVGKPSKKSATGIVVVAILASVAAVAVAVGLYFFWKRKGSRFVRVQSSSALVVHPRDSVSERELLKMNNGDSNHNKNNSGPSGIHVDTGNLVISIHVLRKATNNFNEETIVGRGGFGVVYRGELDDGTMIAVKRMESATVVNKGMSEFEAEIAVLTKVRHRHLVALLGYCIHGREKLLVYEYMPQGTLSQHLFEYSKHGYKALTWKHRLVIALDVARGIEYLHGLAHKSFIHRDLKPSNILLDDELHAKVSDFGLVKLAPEGKVSVETKLAGTFGYLAPEYAVTGRVTTKVDVYSFGVILMELITGRQALDPTRSEEIMHLTSWFRRMSAKKETFASGVDGAIEVTDEVMFESINTVAQLARYCTHREPYQRPDMSHAVNVLAPLIERWKPSIDFDAEENGGVDLGVSLSQALQRWQSSEEEEEDEEEERSETSIPVRPPGFADALSSSHLR